MDPTWHLPPLPTKPSNPPSTSVTKEAGEARGVWGRCDGGWGGGRIVWAAADQERDINRVAPPRRGTGDASTTVETVKREYTLEPSEEGAITGATGAGEEKDLGLCSAGHFCRRVQEFEGRSGGSPDPTFGLSPVLDQKVVRPEQPSASLSEPTTIGRSPLAHKSLHLQHD